MTIVNLMKVTYLSCFCLIEFANASRLEEFSYFLLTEGLRIKRRKSFVISYLRERGVISCKRCEGRNRESRIERIVSFQNRF